MKNGKFIEIENEGIFWYKNGEPHRVDGPAIEWDDGSWFWYNNGMKHRNDGSAGFFRNFKISEWWVGGWEISESEFNKLPRNSNNEIHSEQPINMKLKIKNKECTVYVLDGEALTKEEFNARQLNQELNVNLGNNIKIKKVKL